MFDIIRTTSKLTMINLQDTSPRTLVGNSSNRYLGGIDVFICNQIYEPQNTGFPPTSTAAAALGLVELADESASNRQILGANEDRKATFPMRVRSKGIGYLKFDVY